MQPSLRGIKSGRMNREGIKEIGDLLAARWVFSLVKNTTGEATPPQIEA